VVGLPSVQTPLMAEPLAAFVLPPRSMQCPVARVNRAEA